MGRERKRLADEPSSLPPAEEWTPPTRVKLAEVTENPLNPRTNMRGIEELAESMRERGMLQPLVVVPRGLYVQQKQHLDKKIPRVEFVIIAGHRRILAARLAGLTEVPVHVRMDATSVLQDALIENIQRESLSEIDEAVALRELMDTNNWTQREVASAIGKSQGFVSQRMALLKLPDDIQRQLRSGELTLEQARSLNAKKQTKPRTQTAAVLSEQPAAAAVPAVTFTDATADTANVPPAEHDEHTNGQQSGLVVDLAGRRAAKPAQETLFTVGLSDELTREIIEIADRLHVDPEDAIAQAVSLFVSGLKNT